MMTLRLTLPAALLLLLFLPNCVSTNYYTGRTLKKGEKVIASGVDNLIWLSQDRDILDKEFPFSISLGAVYGLPARFEAGFRSYFPYVYEIHVRHQVDPAMIRWFDMSLNVHSGFFIPGGSDDGVLPYHRLGMTLSREIQSLQPYIGYYHVFNHPDEVHDMAFYRMLCFGVGIPRGHDLILPEWNYCFDPHEGGGFMTFGIGIRAVLPRRGDGVSEDKTP